jgi:hypothetical protein
LNLSCSELNSLNGSQRVMFAMIVTPLLYEKLLQLMDCSEADSGRHGIFAVSKSLSSIRRVGPSGCFSG